MRCGVSCWPDSRARMRGMRQSSPRREWKKTASSVIPWPSGCAIRAHTGICFASAWSADASDPYLVLALSRQESLFNPKATSSSNARGLMQLIPSTASKMAAQNGIDPEAIRLYDPSVNVQLGTMYLKNLFGMLSGNSFHVVAAYNAGENAVSKWIAQSPGPDDEWVENIAYKETRDYVKKVIGGGGLKRSAALPALIRAALISRSRLTDWPGISTHFRLGISRGIFGSARIQGGLFRSRRYAGRYPRTVVYRREERARRTWPRSTADARTLSRGVVCRRRLAGSARASAARVREACVRLLPRGNRQD